MSISLIWAQNTAGVIGVDGDLPWHIPEDLAHFRDITRGQAVIMGRATWQSLPERFRPLPQRRNIVLTRNTSWRPAGAQAIFSISQAMELIGDDAAWVIGGGEIYRQFLPLAHQCEVTIVNLPQVTGTTFAPELGPQWKRTRRDPELGWHLSKTNIQFRFESHTRISVNER